MPGGRICGVAHCGRTCPKGSRICGRCLALVPVETKIAIDGHIDAYEHPLPWAWDGDYADLNAWRRFVTWSWESTLGLAMIQADEAREARELERLEVLRQEFEGN